MKKFKAMILVPMLAIALAGCGSTNTEIDETEITAELDNNDSSDSSSNATADDSNNDENNSEANTDDNNTEAGTDDNTASEDASGSDEITVATEGREILEGGEITDTCLELRTVFIDFEKLNKPDLKTLVEKRSESNLIVTYYAGESNEYDAQYSASFEKVGETKYFETYFPDGYEFVADPNYGDIYYALFEEENGERIVILQDVGDECYLSIRALNKSSLDSLLIIDEIMVKNLPVYWKQ